MNEMNFGNGQNETVNEPIFECNDAVTEESVSEPMFAELFENDLVNGLHSVLYKRIRNLTITDIRLKEAFSRFLNEIDCGESISVAEIIYSAEALLFRKLPNDHCENRIYVYDQSAGFASKAASKLLENSVPGFYALPYLHNGFALDLSAFGGDIQNLETKRFIIASDKKMRKLVSDAFRVGINCRSVGSMLASEKIVLTNCGETIAVFNKERINSAADTETVCLGSNAFEDYLNGYCSVASYVLCESIAPNNLLHFSLDGTIDCVLARALGYFNAVMHFKKTDVNIRFSPISSSVVAVPRPFISEGCYLYLLKVRNDANGMPDIAHLDQLKYYISEKKRFGIIKDALPLRKSVIELINNLGGDKLRYVALEPIPEDSFGIIVSVNRGESLNGIRLGYFTNIE